MYKKLKKAFSLIELSIVILIIGILVAGVTQSSRLISQMRLSSARSLTQSSPVNSISGLAAWFESTQEGSFLENETQEGSTVSKWNDINITIINKATTALAGTAPIYRQNGINSLPALQFSGNGCFYITHANITNNALKTFFAVFLETAKNSASGTYLYDNFTLPPQFAFISTTTFAGQIHGGANLVAGSLPINKAHVLSVVHNTANSFLRINGVESSKGNTGNNIMGSVTRLGGGGCTSVGDSFFGYIGEFIVFDRVLKTEEYVEIEKYLAKKWGIKI